MLPFAYYLLKITICSAVLFGYYWFLLRNKVFHGYNRFYLLAIVGLSLVLPLCRINIFAEKHVAQTSVIKMLQVVTVGDEYMDEVIIAGTKKSIFSIATLLPFVYILISVVLLFLLLQMLFSIFKLIKKYPHTNVENIHFINTEAAKGTPFSFFKFIFWNNEIDLLSPAGTRIFQHEVAHIQEQHSLDKMFINLVLIAFWCNPFFWLIRKELSMIHEFIADEKAVEDGDTAAFAAMILATTYPQHTLTIANNFFYSPIKRRLMMLTKKQHPRMNYFSRLLVLPLLVIVFAAFTIKAKEYNKQKSILKNEIITNKSEDLFDKNILATTVNSEKIKSIIFAGEPIFLTEKQITVVIDAGHGGADFGAAAENGVVEKDLTLQLINKIKLLNKNKNVKLIFTRETDVFANVHDKADFANAQNPDLFISVHLDSKDEKTEVIAGGMHVLVATDDITNAEKSKLFASAIIGTFQKNYELNVMPNPLQRKQGIWLLKASKVPSVLIEAGFITSKKDVAYLQSEVGQEAFAKNVLDAINKFAESKVFVVNQFEKTTILNDSLGIYEGKVVTGCEVNPKMNTVQLIFADKSTKVVSIKEAIEAGIKLPTPPPSLVSIEKNEKLVEENKKLINNGNNEIEKFTQVEQEAQFPGGSEAWKHFLEKNLDATITEKDKWKPGTYPVIIKFLVEKDGTIKEISTTNYVGSKTAEQCIALMKKSPRWKPAKQNGKVVAAYRKQPITFIVVDEGLKLSERTDVSLFSLGEEGGGKIKLADLKRLNISKISNNFEVLSTNIYFGGAGFQKAIAGSLTGNSLGTVKELIDKCVVGSSIAFTNIKVKTKDGIRIIDERAFLIY